MQFPFGQEKKMPPNTVVSWQSTFVFLVGGAKIALIFLVQSMLCLVELLLRGAKNAIFAF